MEDDGGVTVKVTNTGCKLAPGAETRMFDKFYRGDANLSQYGAGLGLTICRGIMQAHGGQLWAERFGADSISICFTLPSQGKPPEIEAEDLTEAKPSEPTRSVVATIAMQPTEGADDTIDIGDEKTALEINGGETKKAQ